MRMEARVERSEQMIRAFGTHACCSLDRFCIPIDAHPVVPTQTRSLTFRVDRGAIRCGARKPDAARSTAREDGQICSER
eukprot:SAG31_NODE_5720_length_2361_cov_1.455349_1_plen_79_part_00